MDYRHLISSLKYLKFKQIIWRIKKWFFRNRLGIRNISSEYVLNNLKLSNYNIKSNQVLNSINIFNNHLKINNIDWKPENKPNLWVYHLHYFDYLRKLSQEDGEKIIYDWIKKNQSESHIAWDPYPISIRAVNWIKFLIKYNINSKKILSSLYKQGIYLFMQREYHLLANHLFKNIVAMLYLSLLFKNKKWEKWAIKELRRQLKEQLTKEGYHFEFSPTYHAIFVKDLLDIYDILKHNCSERYEKLILEIFCNIKLALVWIEYFSVDRKYLQINDINFEGVPKPDKFKKYAEKLGIKYIGSEKVSSNYPILINKNLRIMLYCAPIKPEYNPSHSHADLLSVLLWYDKTPILIDTGNYHYEESEEREYARSTAAHNTISIDQKNQCELWKVFRIGRRSKLVDKNIQKNCMESSCVYYKGVNVTHKRKIIEEDNGFMIKDFLYGKEKHNFNIYFHFHPDITIKRKRNIFLVNNKLKFEFPEGTIKERESFYFPKMYSKVLKKTIIISGSFNKEIILLTKISSLKKIM